MAIEIVNGNVSKFPPILNTEMTAEKPAPMMMPDLIACGIAAITLFAMPVAPMKMDKSPSIIWKDTSACMRSGPSGKVEQ
ncbi:hypothetical protein Q644_22865 [Brucella intermedia 229E]|uniref:Uncharacterized protein n=1 Tax=Brucella intermedia 229E TaxID=1337887 RepID=U4V5F6_9HYPH|nr:hypothetical protein Q644_22865 [Brucella intermedia 229E]